MCGYEDAAHEHGTRARRANDACVYLVAVVTYRPFLATYSHLSRSRRGVCVLSVREPVCGAGYGAHASGSFGHTATAATEGLGPLPRPLRYLAPASTFSGDGGWVVGLKNNCCRLVGDVVWYLGTAHNGTRYEYLMCCIAPSLPNYETAKQQSWGLDRLSVKRE
eukprot:4565944-Prymnesium_polylepis.1